MADALLPAPWRRTAAARATVDVALVLAGSLLVALSAQIQVVLPFTVVPITGQTFAVLLVGAALGSHRGALAMVVYLAEGAAGLPVFSGGACCLPWLLGPTGGYLLSYPLVAGLVGALAELGPAAGDRGAGPSGRERGDLPGGAALAGLLRGCGARGGGGAPPLHRRRSGEGGSGGGRAPRGVGAGGAGRALGR